MPPMQQQQQQKMVPNTPVGGRGTAVQFFLSAAAASTMLLLGVPPIMPLELHSKKHFQPHMMNTNKCIAIHADLRIDAVDYLTQVNLARGPNDPDRWQRVPCNNLSTMHTHTQNVIMKPSGPRRAGTFQWPINADKGLP